MTDKQVTQADRDAATQAVLRTIYGPIFDRARSVSIPAVMNFSHAVEAAASHRVASTAKLEAEIEALSHDFERHFDILTDEVNRSSQLEAALSKIANYEGGTDYSCQHGMRGIAKDALANQTPTPSKESEQ